MAFLKNILWFLCGFITVSQVRAQINLNSLNDVWMMAEKNNIQIATAKSYQLSVTTDVKQAFGELLPTVTANGAFTDNIKIQSMLIPANLFNPAAPSGTFTEAQFGRRYIYTANITTQLDILNTKDWFSIKAEKLNNEIALLNISKTKLEVYEQLANLYYSCLLLQKTERLAFENLQVSNQMWELAQNKFKEGLISEITLNNILINREKSAKSLAVSEENKLLQLNNLKVLLNTRDSIFLSENDRKIENQDSTFADDVNIHWSYKQMMLSKTRWQASKATFAPTLTAVYQYNTQVATDRFASFKNSNTTPQQYWGLRLSVPVFTGNSRYFQIQKSQIDYILKQQQYENVRLQSEISHQNTWSSYMYAKQRWEKAENILRLYQANDTHVVRKLEEGLISLDERLRVFNELLVNQNEYLQSLSDLYIQEYRLKIRQIPFTP